MGLCEHGRRRRLSDECSSASICKHGRQRYLCKDCGGKGICRCRHERRRSACKECGGGSSAASTVGAAGAVSARSAARWQQHLRAQEAAQRLQGVRRQQHLQARAAPYGLQRMRRRQPRAAGCEHGRQRSVCKKASFKRKNNGVRQKQKNLLSCRRACRYDFTLYMAPLVKYAHSDFTL